MDKHKKEFACLLVKQALFENNAEKWIKSDEMLPETNDNYLVYFGEGIIDVAEYKDGLFYGNVVTAGEPIYWYSKPLPKAPEEYFT